MTKEIFYIIILVAGAAIVATVIGYTAPKLTEASDAIGDIAIAPQRSQAKLANESALSAAQVDALRAQTEISKTRASADADAVRTKAQKELLEAQTVLKRTESDGQMGIANIAAGAQTWQAFWGGVAIVLTALLIGATIWMAANVWLTRHQKTSDTQIAIAQIEARKTLMLEAIRQAESGAVISVALDNQHSFKIERPILAALIAPVARVDTPLPMQQATRAESRV